MEQPYKKNGADPSLQPVPEQKPVPETPAHKKTSRRKGLITGGVIAVVILVAGAGFWIWHEQPSFCNAICHQPMDSYVEGYYSEDSALLSAIHEGAGTTCLQCHVPTLTEQLVEGVNWVSGNYEMPLEKMDYDDGFCLNESCHDVDRAGLEKKTDHLKYNPHEAYHEELACNSCHKVHEQSVMSCNQCHSDAIVPENWKAA